MSYMWPKRTTRRKWQKRNAIQAPCKESSGISGTHHPCPAIRRVHNNVDVDAELQILEELARWHESSAKCNMMFDAAAMAVEGNTE